MNSSDDDDDSSFDELMAFWKEQSTDSGEEEVDELVLIPDGDEEFEDHAPPRRRHRQRPEEAAPSPSSGAGADPAPEGGIRILPADFRFPQVKSGTRTPDRFASVRRLEKPVQLHVPDFVDSRIGLALQACPHAADAVEAMAHAERELMAWGTPGRMRPVLLVGPPGSGKSTVARHYHEALGYRVQKQNVAGMADALSLVGTHQTYGDSKPSIVTEAIAQSGMANVCMIMDEVEKAPRESRNGTVQDALLQFLDQGEARAFRDVYLNTSVDVSHVRWVLTANDLNMVTAPLRSRCTVVHVPAPTVEHVPALAWNIIREIEVERNLQPGWFDLSGYEMTKLQEVFTGDMRMLRRCVEVVLREQVRHWARA
ncbi:AAA family ATPase [Novacetimonas maltaceti]|nr:AAA family ATPase [Novacetimonas maltaceti]